ncbi:MAG TPA: hypothetical protein V6C84_00705 [Coleofasciculaceae cyanobacterium]|jgi:hypothetical protein
MLSRDQPPPLPSPFFPLGPGQSNHPQQYPYQHQHQQPAQETQPLERNRGRGFRRAGNACEVAAGASLNSAIIFLFHLLQVHPLGFVVALAGSHFYFIATAFGEGRNKAIGNLMTGASAGIAGLCALSEPISEAWEAQEAKETTTALVQSLYAPQSTPPIGNGWIVLLMGITCVFLVTLGTQDTSHRHPRRMRTRR